MPSLPFPAHPKSMRNDPNKSQVPAALSFRVHARLGITWDEVGTASQVHPKSADPQSAALTYCVSLRFPQMGCGVPPGCISLLFCKRHLIAVRMFTTHGICDPFSRRGSTGLSSRHCCRRDSMHGFVILRPDATPRCRAIETAPALAKGCPAGVKIFTAKPRLRPASKTPAFSAPMRPAS